MKFSVPPIEINGAPRQEPPNHSKASEDTHPLASIEIYQRYAERLIDQRGRDNYRQACEYLTSMGNIYQKIGQSTVWTDYIMSLRAKYKNLPALRDEMAMAKL